jgi:hypothetical protein
LAGVNFQRHRAPNIILPKQLERGVSRRLATVEHRPKCTEPPMSTLLLSAGHPVAPYAPTQPSTALTAEHWSSPISDGVDRREGCIAPLRGWRACRHHLDTVVVPCQSTRVRADVSKYMLLPRPSALTLVWLLGAAIVYAGAHRDVPSLSATTHGSVRVPLQPAMWPKPPHRRATDLQRTAFTRRRQRAELTSRLDGWLL